MKAWEVIEQRGWCQGEFVADDGAVCLFGALEAAYKPEEVCEVASRLRIILGKSALITWNDAYGRTKEEVAALLKEADA